MTSGRVWARKILTPEAGPQPGSVALHARAMCVHDVISHVKSARVLTMRRPGACAGEEWRMVLRVGWCLCVRGEAASVIVPVP